MKLIHLSDLHLGKRVNAFSMLEDQHFILQEILEKIDGFEPAPCAVLISGDIYDKPVPPAEAVRLFDWFLTQLSSRGLQVFVISGNHDSADRIAFGSSLMAKSGVHMSPVCDGTMRPVTLSDEDGPVDIWMLPFLRPADVRRFFAEKDSSDSIEGSSKTEQAEENPDTGRNEQSGFVGSVSACNDSEKSEGRFAETPASGNIEKAEVKASSAQQIRSYTDAVRAALSRAQLNPSHRNVLLAHQFVTGAVQSKSEDASVGGLDNVDADVFRGFDYVALGHIHRPQNMSSGNTPGMPLVRYCGTPLKYSFSEAKDQKSMTLVTLGRKDPEKNDPACTYVRTESIPLVPLRDMREIRGSYNDITFRGNYAGTNTEDYVHITLTDEQEIPNVLGRLRAIYPNVMAIDYDNERTRNKAHLEAAKTLEKTPLELFSEFYKAQNGAEMSAEQKAYVEKIMEEISET